MRDHGTQAGSDEHRRLDKAIVLELLDDRERWPRDELAATVRVDRAVLDSALERLRVATFECGEDRG